MTRQLFGGCKTSPVPGEHVTPTVLGAPGVMRFRLSSLLTDP
jgi:hypothetical protein